MSGITPEQNVTIVNEDASKPGVVSIGPRPAVSQFIDTIPNLCDKTTWVGHAKQRTQVALALESGKIYRYANPDYPGGDQPEYQDFWIDPRRLYRTHQRHVDKVVRVWDNGSEVNVAKEIGENKDSSGIDCEVDYVNGKITFNDSYAVTGPITASFFHIDFGLSAAKRSEYTLCLAAGKDNVIEYVEPQFTKGVDIKDTTIFSAFLTLNWLAVQTDATLDPLAVAQALNKKELEYGMAFRIDDKDNLHANFGTIEGVENGDVVIYLTDRDSHKFDGFVVWMNASEYTAPDAITALDAAHGSNTYVWDGAAWNLQANYPSKLEIPEGREEYPDFWAFLEHATGNFSIIPAGMAINDRGVAHDSLQLKFDWTGSRHLKDTLGIEFRVWLKNGIEFGPDRTHKASATFYGQIHKIVS